MIKKVVFVSLLDAISIPSGEESPRDITDFQLRHDFFSALLSDVNVALVNILGYDKAQITYSSDETFKKMMSVVAYEIATYTNRAALIYHSTDSLQDAFEKALGAFEKVEIIKDKACWLMIGSTDVAESFDIDCISMEDYVNGKSGRNSERVKAGEEK